MHMCTYMRADMCMDTNLDFPWHMFMDLCTDTFMRRIVLDMYTDTCMTMCVNMCMVMCVDTRACVSHGPFSDQSVVVNPRPLSDQSVVCLGIGLDGATGL